MGDQGAFEHEKLGGFSPPSLAMMTNEHEKKAPPTPVEALDMQVWKTKGARFNASRRLILNHYWSAAAVAFLSVYSVVAGVVLLAGSNLQFNPTGVSIALIGVSIGILTLSLLESARSYQLRADRHHRCGMELNELYSEVRYASVRGDDSVVPELTRKYHGILQKYEDNHAPADYEMFLAQHSDNFKLPWCKVVRAEVNWYWRSAGPYLAGIAAPPAIFLLLV